MTTISGLRGLVLCLAAAAALLSQLGLAQAAVTPVYVALGDSYSSGEGACAPVTVTGCRYLPGSSTGSDECHRSANAYAVRTAAALPRGWRFVFAACSGARTANIVTRGQYGEPAQLAALHTAAGSTVRLVTLTIGGNDAGFPAAVGGCVMAHLFGGSCSGTIPWQVPVATLQARLTAVYAAVHRAAPHARLLVLGYPRLFAAHPGVACDVAPADSAAFSTAEDTLDAAVAKAVSAANAKAGSRFATFVDDGRVFNGRELCGASPAKAWLNGLVLRSGVPAPESFHPNRSGQSALAAHLKAAVAAAT